MGRTSCTEPQCLYKGAFTLFHYQEFSQLYLEQDSIRVQRNFSYKDTVSRILCFADGNMLPTFSRNMYQLLFLDYTQTEWAGITQSV